MQRITAFRSPVSGVGTGTHYPPDPAYSEQEHQNLLGLSNSTSRYGRCVWLPSTLIASAEG